MLRKFESSSVVALSGVLAVVLLAAGGCVPIGRDRNLMSESCRGPYDNCVTACRTGNDYDVLCVDRCSTQADKCRAISR